MFLNPPPPISLLQLREEFDRGVDVQLDEEHSIHDVAALLKEFLRDMPDPLLTKELYTAFINTTCRPRLPFLPLTSTLCSVYLPSVSLPFVVSFSPSPPWPVLQCWTQMSSRMSLNFWSTCSQRATVTPSTASWSFCPPWPTTPTTGRTKTGTRWAAILTNGTYD